jgi:acetylxylan esterase
MRLPLSILGATLPLLQAASLQKITADFHNPTNVGFYLYVPDHLPPSPPILVSPHWCHGDALDVYNGSSFASLADKHGFIVIYPDSPNTEDKCWDVSSPGTLYHQSDPGDSLGIVNMVQWTLKRYAADAGRVFVTGVSSGAMMTEVLLGAYPDVFAAGTAFAGVPFGCYAAPAGVNQFDYWNADCAEGRVTHTGAEWKAIVQAAYPGYEGWRPKVQTFHGTADQVLNYTNFGEEVKQWTSVLGLCAKPKRVVENDPLPGWTKSVYGRDGWLEAVSAAGVTHDIGNLVDVVMEWFDLACTGEKCFRWGKGGPLGSSLKGTSPAF